MISALTGEMAQTIGTVIVVLLMVGVTCAIMWPEKLTGGGLAVLAGVFLASHMATSRQAYRRSGRQGDRRSA